MPPMPPKRYVKPFYARQVKLGKHRIPLGVVLAVPTAVCLFLVYLLIGAGSSATRGDDPISLKESRKRGFGASKKASTEDDENDDEDGDVDKDMADDEDDTDISKKVVSRKKNSEIDRLLPNKNKQKSKDNDKKAAQTVVSDSGVERWTGGKTMDHQDFDVNQHKVILVVNVASHCGFTKINYAELPKLQRDYKEYAQNAGASVDDFTVLAFPCNQFGNQESGSDDDIISFIRGKNADFPVMPRTEVNGPNTHPLYKQLKADLKKLSAHHSAAGNTEHVDAGQNVEWNFGKFLYVVGHGAVQYFPHDAPFSTVRAGIDRALKVPVQGVLSDSISLKTLTGHPHATPIRLATDFKHNSVVLVVNLASRCGFTKSNYPELQQMQLDYEQLTFTILGVPCDQFGHQEPGTPEEIEHFARKDPYHSTFPITEKIDVKGDTIHPLYDIMRSQLRMKGDVEWNFGKFLLKDGMPVKYIKHDAPFTEVRQAIEDELGLRRHGVLSDAIKLNDIEGQKVHLGTTFGDKTILVVNIANRCRFTELNYDELQKTHDRFGHSGAFSVVAFPCDQWTEEADPSETVLNFARNIKHATFPIMDKVEVNGKTAHELYVAMKKALHVDEVEFNFGKFLLHNGVPVQYFKHDESFDVVNSAIEKFVPGH